MSRSVQHYQTPVVTIAAGETVRAVADLLRAEEVGCAVVMEGDSPVGIVTDRDLLCRVIAPAREAASTIARDIMSAPLRTAGASDPLEKIVGQMSASGCRRIPIVESGRLLGIVTLDDLLVALSDEVDALAVAARRGAQEATRRRRLHHLEAKLGELADAVERAGERASEEAVERTRALREWLRSGRS